ncbi:MAG: hypothetical protein J1G04_05435 [Clostridiales bacterium]|nr:hypothetical protein [Clostridiales bacterium]
MSTLVLVSVVLGLIITIIMQIVAKASFITVLISLIPYLIIIFLLAELRSDTKKIKRLEKVLLDKRIINLHDIDNAEASEKVGEEDVKLCPNCSFQIFPDDKICPNCQSPVNAPASEEKIDI